MNIKFTVKPNRDELYLNKAVFTLKNGTTIGVDRHITGYTPGFKAGDTFELMFHNFYLWDLNGFNIFTTEGNGGFYLHDTYEKMEFAKLLKGAECAFEYEDEAPDDYECQILSWEIA